MCGGEERERQKKRERKRERQREAEIDIFRDIQYRHQNNYTVKFKLRLIKNSHLAIALDKPFYFLGSEQRTCRR